MDTRGSVLPPDVVISSEYLYAIQGDIFALRKSDGELHRRYPILGISRLTTLKDILYINVNHLADASVQAMHENGTQLWNTKVDGHLAGTPVVADGNVYVGTNEGQVYALRADSGSLLWSHSVSNSLFISPAVNRQIVYIASEKNNSSKPSVYSLQAANGAVLWQTQLPSAVSFPATLEAETVYISTQNGCAALRAADGSILWQHSRDKRDIIRSPLIVLDGVAYTSFSTQRHDNSPLQPKPIKETYICALRTSDGSLLWQRRIEGGNTEIGEPTIPAIDHDAIYIGAGDGILRALRLDGTSLLWYQKTGGNMLSAPVVAGEVVYAGANDGCVYAFQSSDGNLLWKTFVSTSLTVNASVRLSVQQ